MKSKLIRIFRIQQYSSKREIKLSAYTKISEKSQIT